MKKKTTYALLMRSEEKGRDFLETAVYAFCILSAVVSIWQFAQQTDSLPLDRMGTVIEQRADVRVPS